MNSINRILQPNTKILLGFFWILIALIYISDRVINNLYFRLFDWVCWIAIFIAGIISLLEGFRSKKNVSKK